MKQENILVLCAHSDDQAFGAGGTIAKYAEEGKKITVVVFSYGEKGNPWLKKIVATSMRVKESREAGKIIGCRKTLFFNLKEGKFADELKEKKVFKKLKKIIEKQKPLKIFTHSINDYLPDHKVLGKFVIESYDKMKCKAELYAFDIWNPISFRQRNKPRLYVNIAGTFNKKLDALKCFKSQKLAMTSLLWSVYIRAIINGIKSGYRLAERFDKIR